MSVKLKDLYRAGDPLSLLGVKFQFGKIGTYCFDYYSITDEQYIIQNVKNPSDQKIIEIGELDNYFDYEAYQAEDSRETYLATKMLQDMHAFNVLTDRHVRIIGGVFGVDAEKLCSEHGITYTINDGGGN